MNIKKQRQIGMAIFITLAAAFHLYGKKMDKKIIYEQYKHADALSASDARLLKMAAEVARHAHAPYSGFAVGAAVLLAQGEIITGANQENAAFGAGTCAERTAIFHAVTAFPDEAISCIAISAPPGEKTNVSPCGICRQVMAESEQRQSIPIRILFPWEGSIIAVQGVSALLPFAFSLKKQA